MIYETQKCLHTEEKMKQKLRSKHFDHSGDILAPELQNERLLVCYSIYEETSENCAKAKKDGH